MLKFGKENWFRSWINEKVLPFNLDDAIISMENTTKVTLSDQEKQYYNFMFSQMKDKVQEVVDLNYDEDEITRRKKLRTRLKESLSHKVQNITHRLKGEENSKRNPNYDDSGDGEVRVPIPEEKDERDFND